MSKHATGLPTSTTYVPDTSPGDDTAPRWVRIDIKVGPAPGAEYENGFVAPSACEVADAVRRRLEDRDLDTGWIITKVGC